MNNCATIIGSYYTPCSNHKNNIIVTSNELAIENVIYTRYITELVCGNTYIDGLKAVCDIYVCLGRVNYIENNNFVTANTTLVIEYINCHNEWKTHRINNSVLYNELPSDFTPEAFTVRVLNPVKFCENINCIGYQYEVTLIY